MKIAVLGAGGIGGYIGGRLAEIGHDVCLVARGRHLKAITEKGLNIESPLGDAHLKDIKAVEQIADVGTVDLVLVTVKLPALDEIAQKIPSLLTPTTRIVTLQNGVDAKPMIGQYVDPAIIAQGVIYLAAYIKEPGIIMTPGGKHQMLVDQLGDDQTMRTFFDAIGEATAIDVTPVEDSDKTVWGKFTAQSSIAAITAITRMSLGGVFSSTHATELLNQLLAESIAVAAAYGVELDPDHAENVIDLYSKQPAAQSSSLIVDILAGKPTELEWLSGRVHTLGLETGTPTPAHSLVWNALFDYKDSRPEYAL
ncbi:MAG: 2-dehydropantoate 2-reductase [Pseudomonadota bacterium]